MDVKQSSHQLQVSQNTYVESIERFKWTGERNKSESLNESEKGVYQLMVGQLSWVTNATSPDLSFDVMELNVKLKDTAHYDLKRACK